MLGLACDDFRGVQCADKMNIVALDVTHGEQIGGGIDLDDGGVLARELVRNGFGGYASARIDCASSRWPERQSLTFAHREERGIRLQSNAVSGGR